MRACVSPPRRLVARGVCHARTGPLFPPALQKKKGRKKTTPSPPALQTQTRETNVATPLGPSQGSGEEVDREPYQSLLGCPSVIHCSYGSHSCSRSVSHSALLVEYERFTMIDIRNNHRAKSVRFSLKVVLARSHPSSTRHDVLPPFGCRLPPDATTTTCRHDTLPRLGWTPGVARGHIARHDTRAAPFGEGSIDRPPRTPPTIQLHRAPRHTCCAIRRSIDRSAASNKHHPPHNCLLSHRHRASGGPSPTSSLPRGHLLEPGRARGRGARRAPLAARRAARPHRPGAQRDVWRIRKGVGLVPPTTTTRRSHPATRRVASRRVVAATASSSGSSAPT